MLQPWNVPLALAYSPWCVSHSLLASLIRARSPYWMWISQVNLYVKVHPSFHHRTQPCLDLGNVLEGAADYIYLCAESYLELITPSISNNIFSPST